LLEINAKIGKAYQTQSMKMEINEWVKNLIDKFRKEYKNLTGEEKKRISNLENLNPPCQVGIIWIQNRQLKIDFQIVIFTHWKNVNDFDIQAIGPINSQKTREVLEQILKSKENINKSLSKFNYFFRECAVRYTDKLGRIFIKAIQTFENFISVSLFSTKINRPPMVIEKTIIARDSFCWLCIGKVHELQINKIVKDMIERAKVRAKVKLKEVPKRNERIIIGFGTHFYPPIWIGNIPKQSFQDKFWGILMLNYLFEKSFDTKYKKKVLIVDKDGFVAICEKNKEKAIEMLNEIMATTLLFNMQATAIRESEISEVEIDLDVIKIIRITRISGSRKTMRTELMDERWQSFSSGQLSFTRTIVPKQKITEIIKQANKITRNTDVNSYLSIILESYTHFINFEYIQSFIMSWTIIEKYLAQMWIQYIETLKTNKYRRDKLKSHVFWSTDYIIEGLNFGGKINYVDYELFMKLKKWRNDIIHKNRKPPKETVEKCLNLSFSIISKMILSCFSIDGANGGKNQ